jgi:hypothetical protein
LGTVTPAEPVTACGSGSAGLMAACSAMLRDASCTHSTITGALPHLRFVVSHELPHQQPSDCRGIPANGKEVQPNDRAAAGLHEEQRFSERAQ